MDSAEPQSLGDLFDPIEMDLLPRPEEPDVLPGIPLDGAGLNNGLPVAVHEYGRGTDPKTLTAANIKDARVKGLETSVVIQLDDHINIKTGYTYLDTEDRQTGKQLSLRPQDKLNLAVDVSIKDFTVLADYTFVGERFDSSVKRTLSSYSLVNISSSYRVSKGLTLLARGETSLTNIMKRSELSGHQVSQYMVG